MNKKALELWQRCLEESDKKTSFVDLEVTAIKYARMINQLLMQDVIDRKGTGYEGAKVKLEDGSVAKFKEYIKKK